MDLREFLQWSGERGELLRARVPVSPDLELARLIDAVDGRPLLCEELAGYPGWRAASGVCAQRATFAQALGVSVGETVAAMARAVAHPAAPPVLASGPCQEVVEAGVDLARLPIPRYHPLDGGPYVTAGVAVVFDPDHGRNVAFHRLMQLDGRRFAARLVEGRGTHTALHKADPTGDGLPVAIAVGCPLQVLLAAAMSPVKGVDELSVAHALAPTPLVCCRTVPLEVPAEAELILEGRLTHTLTDEGPFPDLTETLDGVRRQPVIEIDCVTHRRDPIFHALLPGGLEHKVLMGMPREPTMFAAVARVARCTGVYVTPGGTSWLHAVVQIDKQGPDDGRRAIEAAFAGHSSLKHVVVVDTDVDISDPAQVEWAIATRFQADRDLLLLTDQPGSSLDPSSTHVPGQKTRTAKMGLDATVPWGAARADFEKLRYEPVDLGHYLG